MNILCQGGGGGVRCKMGLLDLTKSEALSENNCYIVSFNGP